MSQDLRDTPSPESTNTSRSPSKSGQLTDVAAVLCGVLEDEFAVLQKEAPWLKAVEMLDPALHRNPEVLQQNIQDKIDALEAQHQPEAILLVYGLCSRGIENVRARRARLVIARAHDCITLLLGDRFRYRDYMKANPNAYWYSRGWIKWLDMPSAETLEKKRREFIEKYGEEDAEYLMEVEEQVLQGKKAVFVDLGLTESEEDIAYTRNAADSLGWKNEILQGDPTLLRDLLQGNWDDDRFAIAEPGETFQFVGEDRIIGPVACSQCPAFQNRGETGQ